MQAQCAVYNEDRRKKKNRKFKWHKTSKLCGLRKIDSVCARNQNISSPPNAGIPTLREIGAARASR